MGCSGSRQDFRFLGWLKLSREFRFLRNRIDVPCIFRRGLDRGDLPNGTLVDKSDSAARFLWPPAFSDSMPWGILSLHPVEPESSFDGTSGITLLIARKVALFGFFCGNLCGLGDLCLNRGLCFRGSFDHEVTAPPHSRCVLGAIS